MSETTDPAPSRLAPSDAVRVAARNSNVAALMTFAAFLGLGFALPFLPLFIQELGVHDPADAAQWAGFLIGVGPLLAGVLAPFWGGLADRHGYKPVAVLALIAIGLGQVVAALAARPSHVLISRILSGLFGGIGPLGLAMASGAGARGKGGSSSIGKIQAAQILAAGFGPLLGGALASLLGIRAAFWGASVACLFAAVVVGVFYLEDLSKRPSTGTGEAQPAAPLAGRFFATLVFTVFFVNFAARSFTPILPAQLRAFGLPAESLAFNTGLLISVYSLAAAVSSFGFGRLSVSIEPVRLLTASLSFSLAAAIWMAYVQSFRAFLGVAAIFGLVSGGTLTLGYTIGSRRFAQASRHMASLNVKLYFNFNPF